MHPLIQLKQTIAVFLVTFGLACFGLSPTAQAVLPSPTPDGGYPNQNTAEGDNALLSLTTGGLNTATGFSALQRNTAGSHNTASGVRALSLNMTGSGNTAVGDGTLGANTTGSFNTAIGYNAGANLTTGRDNIDIQALGVAGESNTMRIGTVRQTATFITGISGATVTGAPVVVNAAGQLGVAPSSARFKDEIKPMDKASEAILALKPITFHYKKEIDPNGIPQFGLVAEEVVKVNPSLVTRDADGKPFTVRYDAVNAMLLNEFLKEHRTVQNQQKEIDALKTELKEQRAFIQRVNDKVELTKPAPQTVLNNQ